MDKNGPLGIMYAAADDEIDQDAYGKLAGRTVRNNISPYYTTNYLDANGSKCRTGEIAVIGVLEEESIKINTHNFN